MPRLGRVTGLGTGRSLGAGQPASRATATIAWLACFLPRTPSAAIPAPVNARVLSGVQGLVGFKARCSSSILWKRVSTRIGIGEE
jgi:hypothetical protein